MGFPDSVVAAAWRRAGGRCEYRRRSHNHSYVRCSKQLVQSKRGQMLNVEQEVDHISMRVKMPVAEMIGLAGDLRGATEGRATFALVDQMFERTPTEIQRKVVRQIRSRKGLAENE